MKAAVIYENGGPEVLRYEEVPDPECPDGCVLIASTSISTQPSGQSGSGTCS